MEWRACRSLFLPASLRSFLLSLEEIGERAEAGRPRRRPALARLGAVADLRQRQRQPPFVRVQREYYHVQGRADRGRFARVPELPSAAELARVQEALDPGRDLD